MFSDQLSYNDEVSAEADLSLPHVCVWGYIFGPVEQEGLVYI
jgi:hypothetical protein